MMMCRAQTRWLVLLLALHALVACAGFFSPYDPAEQDRNHVYLPPQLPHLVDAAVRWHLRPFVYPLKPRPDAPDQYEQDTAHPAPLKFFVSGSRYRLLGVLPARLHLFGGEEDRICLLGTDAYGRDQFSRFLHGGQISLLAGFLGTALTLLIGTLVGSIAGYFGGLIDDVLMRLAELFLALPWLYLLFALRAFLPLAVSPMKAFFLIIGVIGAVGCARPGRLVR